MFNLNENNRIVMAQHPTDMRKGVNTLCGQVRMLGLDPSDGKVYIFVDSSRKVMKILHWEHGGYVVYYKRLETSGSDPVVSKFAKKAAKWPKMKHRGLTPLFQNVQKKAVKWSKMKHRGLTPLFQNWQKSCKVVKNETSGSDPIVSKFVKKSPAKSCRGFFMPSKASV